MNINRTRNTLLALLLTLPGFAQAVSESEPNHPAGSAQRLEIDTIVADGVSTTGAIVDGVIGVNSGAAQLDLDFYVFEGKAGDVVTIDIDKGWDGARRVDTIIGVFGPAPTYKLLNTNDDFSPFDSGSARFSNSSLVTRDSKLVNVRLPADGEYTVGVSAFPRAWANGGVVTSTKLGADPNGDYQLVISGVTPPVMQISIEVKPGSGDVAPINPKSRGKVPVALMGSKDFLVDEVDVDSLTFGHSGDERSLSKCGTSSDVDGDLFPDMVCHFDNQTAHWDSMDEEGILRGRLSNGKRFEGRAWLKVVPMKVEE